MKKLWILLFFLFAFFANSSACRFTIREIGYTSLNIENYLVQIEADTTKNKSLVSEFRKLAGAYSRTANINYKIVHVSGKYPEIKCLNSTNQIILNKVASSKADIRVFYDRLLFSPLQQTIYSQIGKVFAFVVVFTEAKNGKLNRVVDKTLEQFNKIAPNLDKKIVEPIMKIIIYGERRKQEELVLRAMGIDFSKNKPVAVVIYGRGRLTAKPLSGDNISTENLLNQLVTLGTDCECGINLSPLLQRAIPFNWNENMGQAVANMLDIDVENPMILTEMGRILSKEPLETGKSDFSFVPQTIDLDKELGKSNSNSNDVKEELEQERSVLQTTLIILGVFMLLIIGVGLFLFFKAKD